MTDSAARSLVLLERLSGSTPWSAASLALELGVTERTVRRDVARLRDLGYPVDTVRGDGGGYRVAPGASLPAVVLTEAEAAACVLALSEHPDSLAADDFDAALAKVRASLPRHASRVADAVLAVRRRVRLTGMDVEPHPAEADLLGRLARACRGRRRVELDYPGTEQPATAGGREAQAQARTIDPLLLVSAARRWHLVGFDVPAGRWCILAVDRVRRLTVTDVPVRERGAPARDLDRWVVDTLSAQFQQVTATVRVAAPADDVRRIVAPAWGRVEAVTDHESVLRVGASDHDAIARWLLLLDAEVTVVEPDELRTAFARVARRARRAAEAAPAAGRAG